MDSKTGGKTGTKLSQGHKNRRAFKLKWKKDKILMRETEKIDRVCTRCYEQIRWKLKFGKYKPLKNPAKCQKCNRKRVLKPYRSICKTCCDNIKCCAKCGEVKEIHPEAQDVKTEFAKMKNKQEFEKLVGMMQERSRRKINRLLDDDLLIFRDGKFYHDETKEEITPIHYQKKYWDELGIEGGSDEDLLG